MITIREAKSEADILHCYPALKALRPHLLSETVGELVGGMMSRGYHLLYIDDGADASCICGYRFTEHLAWGKVIYIDDLGTTPDSRGKGFASAMLDYVFELAQQHKLDGIHLDSGSNPQRYDAHRLYLRKGFNISSFHFVKNFN